MSQKRQLYDMAKSLGERGFTRWEAQKWNPPIMNVWQRVRELEADGCLFKHIPDKSPNGKRIIRYILTGVKQKPMGPPKRDQNWGPDCPAGHSGFYVARGACSACHNSRR